MQHGSKRLYGMGVNMTDRDLAFLIKIGQVKKEEPKPKPATKKDEE